MKIVIRDQLGNKLSPQSKSCIVSEVTQFIAIYDDRNLNLGKIIDLSHLDDHYEIGSCRIRTKNFKINFPKSNDRYPRSYLEGYAGEVIPLSPINNKVPIQTVIAGKKLVDHLQEFFPSEPGNESTVRQWATFSGIQPDVIKNQKFAYSVSPSNYFLYMYFAGLQTV